VGNPKKKISSKTRVCGGLVLKLILKAWDEGGDDRINVVSDTCHRRAVVNPVMNHHVPENVGKFPTC
jgi:hypothetical protein